MRRKKKRNVNGIMNGINNGKMLKVLPDLERISKNIVAYAIYPDILPIHAYTFSFYS